MQINEYTAKKHYLGKLDYDQDLLEQINNFCFEKGITIGTINAIGALKNAHLGYYNQKTKQYESFKVNSAVEIVNCSGNISLKEGKPFAHIHLIVSDNKGKCYAGHTMPGCKIFACEISITQLEGTQLTRELDNTTSLPLWSQT